MLVAFGRMRIAVHEGDGMDGLRRWCSIGGPTILLVAWLTQQFLFDRWNGQLSRLDSAGAIWETYRSNNYIFNALRKDPGPVERADNVVKWQLRNLEVGAQKVERLIDRDVLAKARGAVLEAEDGGIGGPDGAMDIRFKTLFPALDEEQHGLLQKKRYAGYAFWSLYLLGTATTILGTILRELGERRKTLASAAAN